MKINKFIDNLKPLMNKATDRNTVTINNYQFYFNKILKSRVFKIQNDVLTKETIIPTALKVVSYLRNCRCKLHVI